MKLQITPLNTDAAENGAWIEYRGVQLLVARGNNTKFKAAFRRVTKPYQREIDGGTLSEEKSSELLAEALADSVLLGWKGFLQDGKEIEYSKINAKNLLINDPDCREFISDFANDIENFIMEDINKVAGE